MSSLLNSFPLVGATKSTGREPISHWNRPLKCHRTLESREKVKRSAQRAQIAFLSGKRYTPQHQAESIAVALENRTEIYLMLHRCQNDPRRNLLPVNLSPMPNREHKNEQPTVVDVVNDPIVTDANAAFALTTEYLY